MNTTAARVGGTTEPGQLLLTLDSAAAELSMPYQKVYDAVRSGAMRSYRIGRRLYVEPDDALAWVRSHPSGTTNPGDT